ncbi:hypothetical protein [Ruminococcus sp.]|uniref:hypothetical protein n=1 Tax=Ruminococcus sp. TaxID=41978 RepID=UPI0025F2A223|nr:hypothetical protein [Ruminococcus sp.]
MKKILALAAALVFTFSAISVSAAGNPPENIIINVDGYGQTPFVDVGNDIVEYGNIKYVASDETLYLNSANINEASDVETIRCGIGITSTTESELTINLTGDNFISADAAADFGIYSNNTNITFVGTGTLQIEVPTDKQLFSLQNCSILAGKDMVIRYGADRKNTSELAVKSENSMPIAALSSAKYMLMTFNNDSETDTSGKAVKTDSKAVSATYVSADDAATVYSVDISWGSLEYTYKEGSKGTWNPTIQKYEGAVEGGWSCANGADTITITNHSNAAITASLGFTANTGYSDIAGTFYNNNTVITSLSLKSAEGLATDSAPTASAKLKISGKLSESSEKQNVGSVTVSIAAK